MYDQTLDLLLTWEDSKTGLWVNFSTDLAQNFIQHFLFKV
jgi:hypothetical protein